MRKKSLIFIKYYLPALIWAGIIFYFSSRSGLRYFSESAKEMIFRKSVHFVEFSILVFFLWRIFYSAHKLKIRKAYWFSLALAILYGFSDEWHQTFVNNRTGKIIDAVFDSVCVVLFLELILIYTRKKIIWKNILILICSTLALIGLELKMIQDGKKINENSVISESEMIRINIDESILEVEPPIGGSTSKIEEKKLVEEKTPDEILIDVSFISQAPFANWDEYHEEACEEASLIMMKYYLDKKRLDKETAEKEIQSIIQFEIKNYGDYRDHTAEEIVQLARDFYNLKNLKIIYDFKKEDIKKELARGYPIIIPAAGRLLGNPNFTYPGPLYHALVLVGYDEKWIITNDPGTRKGEGYKYKLGVLYDAIHDFPGDKNKIEQGRKAMIVVE